MLECTGTPPRSLDTTPPAALAPPAHNQGAPVTPSPVVTGKNKNATTRVAPLSNGCLGDVSLGDRLEERNPESEGDSRVEGTDVSSLASTESRMPRPLARNVVVEFGDTVGERATRAALNRAAAFGEGRIDPRAVVAVEREALAELQNPRLVSYSPYTIVVTSRHTSKECCFLRRRRLLNPRNHRSAVYCSHDLYNLPLWKDPCSSASRVLVYPSPVRMEDNGLPPLN